MKRILSIGLGAVFSILCLTGEARADSPVVDPGVVNAQIGRAINIKARIAGFGPPGWRHNDWEDRFAADAKNRNFSAIRLWVWGQHADNGGGDFNPAYLDELERIVKVILSHNLVCILVLKDDDEFVKTPDTYKWKFLKYWRQLSERFSYDVYGKGEKIVFELLNEPNDELDDAPPNSTELRFNTWNT